MVLFLCGVIISSSILWTSTRSSQSMKRARSSTSSTSALSSSPALSVPLRSRGTVMGTFTTRLRGGQGAITHFNSHWKIKSGVADATDCALATHHNRVALKGKLDLVSERYDNVIVALLDDKGCAKFKQSISGPFRKPQISSLSVAESLAGPFSHLYRKAKRFVKGGKCEVIYDGSVQQPPQ